MFDKLYNFAVHNELPEDQTIPTTGITLRLKAQEYLLDCLRHFSNAGNKDRMLDEILNMIPMFFQELPYIKAHWEHSSNPIYTPVMDTPYNSRVYLEHYGSQGTQTHEEPPPRNPSVPHLINNPKCTLLLDETCLLDSITEAIADFKIRHTRAHHSVEYKWNTWTLAGYYFPDHSTMSFMVTTTDAAKAAEGLRTWHTEYTARINHGGEFTAPCVDVRAFQDAAFDLYTCFHAVCMPNTKPKAEEKIALFLWYSMEFKLPVSLYDPAVLYNEGVENGTTWTMTNASDSRAIMFTGYQPSYPYWMCHNASSPMWRS
jgi:hypothetical protein